MSKVDKTQLYAASYMDSSAVSIKNCSDARVSLMMLTLEGMSMTTDACLALKTMIQKTAALMAESVLAISGYISGMAGMEDGLLIKDAMCRKRTYAVLQTLSMNLTGDSREAAAGQ